jgi:hypothetical protein
MRLLSTLAAGIFAAGTLASAAVAAPIANQNALSQATATFAPVEKTQYYYPYAGVTPYAYGGYNYCWYPRAWRGPGWYQCGFAWRRGYGWGGPWAWGYGRGWGRGWGYGHGWHGGGWHGGGWHGGGWHGHR